MALFGDEDGDVGPFSMAEDGEEWFSFTLDNLEMDRGCTPLQVDVKPMEQEAADYGETDQDDDVDAGPPAGASGPGPPDRGGGGGGGDGGDGERDTGRENSGELGKVSGAGGQGQACEKGSSGGGRLGGEEMAMAMPRQGGRDGGAKDAPVPPPKARLDRVKAEAKEVHEAPANQKRRGAEAAQAKRGSRGSKGDAKGRHRAAGGMAGGVGGMPGRSEAAPWLAGKDRGGGEGTKMSGGVTKAPTVQNRRRLERNAREQKRSLKISQRIEDLRRMLSQFGVDVKTSKSAVLSEATDYIAHLQRQQAQSEAERAKILQLLHNAQQQNNDGAATPTAAAGTAVGGLTPVTAAGSGCGGGAGAGAIAPAVTAAAGPHTGRTVKPPPSGAPLRGLAPYGGGGLGCGGGADAITESWIMGEGTETAARANAATAARQQHQTQTPQSLASPAGAISAAAACATAEEMDRGCSAADMGTVVAGSSAGILLPEAAAAAAGYSSLSSFARAERTDTVPLQAATSSGVMSATVMPPPPPQQQGAAGNSGLANLEATARALSHVSYERVFRTVPLPMAIANVNGNLVDCNARLTQFTGFRREEVLFMTIFDLVADPFLQHTFSMISSILSLRGVANPPFFQVLGKRRDGTPGGVVQISVVQDEALRPLHFCVCIMETGSGTAVMATAAAATGTTRPAGATAASVGGGGGGGYVAATATRSVQSVAMAGVGSGIVSGGAGNGNGTIGGGGAVARAADSAGGL